MSDELLIAIAAVAPFAAGYLCGSIPFGLVLSRMFGYGDVRASGSGNIGATNVLRHAGKPMAAATLACDLLKGTAGVVAGWFIMSGLITHGLPNLSHTSEFAGLWGSVLGGLGAFLGHLYPVWLRFKGGKGVATLIGVLLGLDWRLAVAFAIAWLFTALVGRMSSLAALVATVVIAMGAWLVSPMLVAVAVSVMSLLVIARHAANISRLRKGEEPKIGGQRETADN